MQFKSPNHLHKSIHSRYLFETSPIKLNYLGTMEAGMRFCVLLWIASGCLLGQAQAFAVHQGCYVSTQDGVRAFPFKAAASDSMTPEGCRKLATNRFVSSFAVEAGRECWLDPLNSGLAQLTRFGAGNACDTPCAGDARIVCGGQQQASVYLENGDTPAVPPNDYAPVGCFKDDPASRRLTLLWVANNSMSVDLCASLAFSEQYLVFGVQGGSECWAGQAVDKALGPSTACTTPCPGSASQQCGGTLALSLYSLQKAPWLEADATAKPSLLVAGCVGAAAGSEACKGPVPSAAAAVVAPRLLVGLAAVAAVML